jgi:restriction system protein
MSLWHCRVSVVTGTIYLRILACVRLFAGRSFFNWRHNKGAFPVFGTKVIFSLISPRVSMGQSFLDPRFTCRKAPLPMPNTVPGILAYVFGLLFGLWPLSLLASLTWRGRFFRKLLVVWGFWALVRAYLLFFPTIPSVINVIPEPTSTHLLFALGPVLMLGAFIAQYRRRGHMWDHVRRSGSVQDLSQVSPTEFENMVVEWYRSQGHETKRVGGSGDHGIDVVVKTIEGERWIVQCKRWKGYVGEPTVRDVYGALQHEGADRAVVVTTGRFTPQARQWADGKPISLIEGQELLRLLKHTEAEWRPSRGAQASYAAEVPAAATEVEPFVSVEPCCPKCGAAMTIRVAHRGVHQGERFYGCTNYPGCRGTRPISG